MNSYDLIDMYKEMKLDTDLGCVMQRVEPLPVADLPEEILYRDENRFWLDGMVGNKEDAHCTLLYGLLPNYVNKTHVDKVLGDWFMFDVMIDRVGFFESPNNDYYCIVAHLDRDYDSAGCTVYDAHKRLSFLPHINTFEDYHPHITLAYIKPNLGALAEIVSTWDTLLAGHRARTSSRFLSDNLAGQPAS